MEVLAIEPYDGGSHHAFLSALDRYSRHRWRFATLPARHWKWRMRSAPMAILNQVAELAASREPDALLCSDMLDLATWLGFAARDRRLHDWVTRVPIVVYFHENQWVYPPAPGSRVDHHYAFTNLTSAAAANECWFNSEFNRRTFLEESRAFLRRMPDDQDVVDVQAVEERSHVLTPGFDHPSVTNDGPTLARKRGPASFSAASNSSPLRIGWVGRFEHDKRPDRFLELLTQLNSMAVDFQLILLGERGRQADHLDELKRRFADQILHDGFAPTTMEYEKWLGKLDVAVSTADHEFFGIAFCQAIWAGAIPVAPNDLSYVEYVPRSLRYESLPHAANLVAEISKRTPLQPEDSVWQAWQACRKQIEPLRAAPAVAAIDDQLQRLIDSTARP
ncbi:DUF3524 domain-containing protein [Roseiconus nitratireducens]|uniref:tRNA-queuosine alpha-mannosyltransferase n=1 Tax=Roseiconus nitratireducens TaxID=2605748 RepID=A0A5M6DDA8_9BACT|nr:DUF3524 domain-containing protein [Roseiconus nitratireducens]KAA5545557.1 DUF3524 domain-containing protein [Roseiconus nitratireducens]